MLGQSCNLDGRAVDAVHPYFSKAFDIFTDKPTKVDGKVD